MVDFRKHLAAASGTCLWIDDTDYSTRLLAGGVAPWLDVASLIAWRQQAHALLRPAVTVLDASALVEAWLSHDGGLREMVISEKRPADALGILLGDEKLKAHVSAALKGLKRIYSGQPLALVVLSPLTWVLRLIELVQDARPNLDEEEVEEGAVNLADFVRAFGNDEVDVLVLQEDTSATKQYADLYELYEPVFNISRHYRWTVGLDHTRLRGPTDIDMPVDFILTQESAEICTGLDVSASVWAEGVTPAAPHGGFRYLRIPADAKPEEVLTRLAVLRT